MPAAKNTIPNSSGSTVSIYWYLHFSNPITDFDNVSIV